MSKRKPRRNRGPNKAVRFYFEDWEAETADLTRAEWGLLLDICIHNWRKREPVSFGRLNLLCLEQPERDAWAGLVRKNKVSRTDDGWTAHLVRKMVKHNSLKRLATDLWAEIRGQIFERDDYICQYCGKRGGRIECDHRVPLSRGGSNEDDNLATACLPCNRRKGDRTPEEMGWV